MPRYNIYPAAELDGQAAPGYSQGQAIEIMEKLAKEMLPEGFSFEWTTLAFQQIRAGSTAAFAFGLGVVFVFLVLAAQFESLTLPLAVVLIVPMCLVSAIIGVLLRGQDNNILTQVGFVVLIALAAKNAILIVEFARAAGGSGRDRFEAAVEAAHLRFRPILMTSLAFIFGVVPLVWAVGAGSELRQTLGTTVFSGMIGVTVFGLIFTPVFYVLCRRLALRGGAPPTGVSAEARRRRRSSASRRRHAVTITADTAPSRIIRWHYLGTMSAWRSLLWWRRSQATIAGFSISCMSCAGCCGPASICSWGSSSGRSCGASPLAARREVIIAPGAEDAVPDADALDHHRDHRLVPRQGPRLYRNSPGRNIGWIAAALVLVGLMTIAGHRLSPADQSLGLFPAAEGRNPITRRSAA